MYNLVADVGVGFACRPEALHADPTMLLWQRLQQSLAQQPGHCVVEASGSGAAWNGPQLLALVRRDANWVAGTPMQCAIDRYEDPKPCAPAAIGRLRAGGFRR